MGKMRAADRRSVYRAVIYHLIFIRSITSCDRKGCFAITACDTAHRKCTILRNSEAEFSRFTVIHLLFAVRCNLRIRPRIVFHASTQTCSFCSQISIFCCNDLCGFDTSVMKLHRWSRHHAPYKAGFLDCIPTGMCQNRFQIEAVLASCSCGKRTKLEFQWLCSHRDYTILIGRISCGIGCCYLNSLFSRKSCDILRYGVNQRLLGKPAVIRHRERLTKQLLHRLLLLFLHHSDLLIG